MEYNDYEDLNPQASIDYNNLEAEKEREEELKEE